MNELLILANAERVNFDFCTLGMKIEEWDGLGFKPVKNRTSVVTNSVKFATELLQRQCKGDHVHANTLGGRIKQCEIYPEEFCDFLCRAV